MPKYLMYLFTAVFFISCQFETEDEKTSKVSQRQKSKVVANTFKVGEKVDSFNQVYVYHNGRDYTQGHGYHYGKDKYLLGQKWQCVEFVKRYYYEVFNHKMPNVYGNATNFFYTKIPHGKHNADRDLIQYKNGHTEKPKVHDSLVFQNSKYGHVAIVSRVAKDYVEIVQQNILYTPREKLPLYQENNKYTIGKKYKPVGWLRKE